MLLHLLSRHPGSQPSKSSFQTMGMASLQSACLLLGKALKGSSMHCWRAPCLRSSARWIPACPFEPQRRVPRAEKSPEQKVWSLHLLHDCTGEHTYTCYFMSWRGVGLHAPHEDLECTVCSAASMLEQPGGRLWMSTDRFLHQADSVSPPVVIAGVLTLCGAMCRS